MDRCDGPEIGMGRSRRDLASTYVLRRRVPNFGRRGSDWRSEIGDDFVIKNRSQTKVTRREIQVIEQEEDLRDKCSERTMSKIS